MSIDNTVYRNELFYCEHLVLSRETMYDVDEFKISRIEGKGLVEYLQYQAFQDEKNGAQRIYLVRDLRTDELVAYFGLKTGLISNNERKISLDGKEQVVFDTVSGIELAEFAINDNYIAVHPDYKGCGVIIFNDFILRICEQVKEIVGCEILFGYSVDTEGKLLQRYLREYGFERLDPESEERVQERFRPFFDKGCVFIYQKI